MALLTAGTRLLMYNRSSVNITYITTPGTPARYNTSIVSGGVAIPPRGLGGTQFVGYVHRTGLPVAWFHWDEAWTGNTSVFWDFLRIVDAGGNQLARIYANSPSLEFYSTNNLGAPVLRGSIISASSGLTTYDIEYTSGLNGGIRAFRGGVPWFSFTWTNGSASNVAGIQICNPVDSTTASEQTVISQFAMSDGDDLRGFLFPSQVLTGTGFYNDGSGTPAETGDLNFTTGKSLPAATNKFTGTKPAYTFPTNATIEGVMVNSYIRTSGTPPNARIMTRLSGIDGFASNMLPAPNSGFVTNSQYLTLNPSTGTPWLSTDYNNSEFGIEARS